MRRPVRLAPKEVEAVINDVLRVAQNENVLAIHLFGSRADPRCKGGDIDLWIETAQRPIDARLFARRIRLALEGSLGEQKIDVLVASASDPVDAAEASFLRHISSTKATLWPKK